jgi:hypothetical protein
MFRRMLSSYPPLTPYSTPKKKVSAKEQKNVLVADLSLIKRMCNRIKIPLLHHLTNDEKLYTLILEILRKRWRILIGHRPSWHPCIRFITVSAASEGRVRSKLVDGQRVTKSCEELPRRLNWILEGGKRGRQGGIQRDRGAKCAILRVEVRWCSGVAAGYDSTVRSRREKDRRDAFLTLSRSIAI